MTFIEVNRKEAAIIKAIAVAPVYRKKGEVKARPAVEGEIIKTILSSGAEETTNTVKKGDWVATNPSGEQYIIEGRVFDKRYERTESPDVYRAKGYCRAIKNPFGYPVKIVPEWGGEQTGNENCLFADICDKNGQGMPGEPYLIDANAFEETYELVE